MDRIGESELISEMTMTPEERSFWLAGQALSASQMFEVAFVIAAKFAIDQRNVTTIEEVVAKSESKMFKEPVKNILKNLREASTLNVEIANRVEDLLNDRNKLIHQSGREFGWPTFFSAEAEQKFDDLCLRVITESTALGQILYRASLAWMDKFPSSYGEYVKDTGVTKGDLTKALDTLIADRFPRNT